MRTFIISCVLLAGAFGTQAGEPTGPAGQPSEASQQSPSLASHSQFAKEESWVVEQITRDIAETIAFARGHEGGFGAPITLQVSQPDPASPIYSVVVQGPGGRIEHALPLKSHLWSAETYRPFAAAILDAWKPAKPATLAADVALLNSLTVGEPATLIRQSKRLSELLTRRPLDPELHDQAALILGCFGLREAAGCFNDPRPVLSRMTAHLSLARALAPEESESGKLARIISLSLVHRQNDALEALATLSPASSPWASALKLRVTGDWRALGDPAKASPLEQMEYFRALKLAHASTKALDFLLSIHASSSPEWNRVAMEQPLSVQEGHAFVEKSLVVELVSLGADAEIFFGHAPQRSELTELLNRPASGTLTRTIEGEAQLEVLSWGDLAAFHQRHLCQSVVMTGDFLRHRLGVPEAAQKFEQQANQLLSGLTMYPLVRLKTGPDPKGGLTAQPAAEALWANHPEMVTAENARVLETRKSLVAQWFSPILPFGTAFELPARYQLAGSPAMRRPNGFALETLMLAPYDLQATRLITQAKFGAFPSAEQMAEVAARIKDFNLEAMTDIVDGLGANPAVYTKQIGQICELEPDYFISLGRYLVKHQLPTEAAQAYQSGFDRARDRIYVANNCQWLVDYYFEHGRQDEAQKIARDAAESYSSRGLETMASLMEKMQRFSEAEEYYKKIKERYDDPGELNAFYFRNKARTPEYAHAAEALQASIFPNGMEPAQLQTFSGPPHDGVLIRTSSPLVHAAGLKVGDVIVAIEGARVRSLPQYSFLRDRDPNSKMTLIVWNGAAYAEVPVDAPKRRMNCDIATLAVR